MVPPVEVVWVSTGLNHSGIRLNGISLSGLSLSGISLSGLSLQQTPPGTLSAPFIVLIICPVATVAIRGVAIVTGTTGPYLSSISCKCDAGVAIPGGRSSVVGT